MRPRRGCVQLGLPAVNCVSNMCHARQMVRTRMQLREELDNASKLNKARRDLAFGAAQADINQKYDELEAELRKSREELEVRKLRCCAAFVDWRARTRACAGLSAALACRQTRQILTRFKKSSCTTVRGVCFSSHCTPTRKW